jgi:hypothetical protein
LLYLGWGSSQVLAAFLGDRMRVRDLSLGVVTATVFLAETLMLKGVYVGVVYLSPGYELVEGVGGVRWSSK